MGFFYHNTRLCAMTRKAVTLCLLANHGTSVSDDLNVRKEIWCEELGTIFGGGVAGVLHVVHKN